MQFILIMISPCPTQSRSSPHPIQIHILSWFLSLENKQTNIKTRQPNEILKIKICQNIKKKQETHTHANTQRKLEIII